MSKREYHNLKFPFTTVSDKFVKKSLPFYMKKQENKTANNIKKIFSNRSATFGKRNKPVFVDVYEFED